jgi:hypothetical protein
VTSVHFKAVVVDAGSPRSSLLLSFLNGGVGPPEEEERGEGSGSCHRSVPSKGAVIRALDNCYDPCCQDRKMSVVDMGLIESIDIDARRVRIEMVLNCQITLLSLSNTWVCRRSD